MHLPLLLVFLTSSLESLSGAMFQMRCVLSWGECRTAELSQMVLGEGFFGYGEY